MPYRIYSTLSARIRQFRARVLAPNQRRNLLFHIPYKLLAIALLGGLLGLGILLCLALTVLSTIHRLLRGNTLIQPVQNDRVMEGQYRVVTPESDRPPSP